MIEKTETRAIIKALIQAQAEFTAVVKDRTNPFYSNKYATLESVIAATAPWLHKYGLTIIQTFEPGPSLRTTLWHENGESITGVQPLIIEKNTAQGVASAATYARRYGWQAIIGVTADDDDDGNAAENNSKKLESKPAAKAEPAIEIEGQYQKKLDEIILKARNAGLEQEKKCVALLDQWKLDNKVDAPMFLWSTTQLKSCYEYLLSKKQRKAA
jgi:hypothetical protein